MGDDAVTCAALAGGADVKGCFVRKEAKAHGLSRRIEGPCWTAGRCLVVEDVVSTGGSTIAAIEALQEAGHEICGVVSVLDRLAGGGERIRRGRRAVPRAGHDRRRLPRAPGPGVAAAARRPGRGRPG